MTQPAPGPATKGPIGQTRDAGQQALLSLVTCGIYAYYWIYLSGEELKEHNREGLGGIAALLLTFVVVGPFIVAAEIQKTYQQDGREAPVTPLTALWLLLPLAGVYIYVQKMQTALNDYWMSKGAAPAA
jgi:Zn-dependent protease